MSTEHITSEHGPVSHGTLLSLPSSLYKGIEKRLEHLCLERGSMATLGSRRNMNRNYFVVLWKQTNLLNYCEFMCWIYNTLLGILRRLQQHAAHSPYREHVLWPPCSCIGRKTSRVTTPVVKESPDRTIFAMRHRQRWWFAESIMPEKLSTVSSWLSIRCLCVCACAFINWPIRK